jgi:hypothetical protein
METIAMLDADLHGLREQVKALELEAERHLLLRLRRRRLAERRGRSLGLAGRCAAGATSPTTTRCAAARRGTGT